MYETAKHGKKTQNFKNGCMDRVEDNSSEKYVKKTQNFKIDYMDRVEDNSTRVSSSCTDKYKKRLECTSNQNF